jgi:hypothetical protein
MSMREVNHGGIIKKPTTYINQPREALDLYGLDPTIEHGGITLPPENYNGIETVVTGGIGPGQYYPPLKFTPDHGGVQEVLHGDYAPAPGEQP